MGAGIKTGCNLLMETTMQKLILQFNLDPTVATARKLVTYAAKHPMAQCLLDARELITLNKAADMLELLAKLKA